MKLLFLCTHNACRSIIAESLAKQIGGDIWKVESAGSAPAGHVHPFTLATLKTRLLPTDDLHSKSWEDVQHFQPDIVITVCDQAAGESCLVWFGQAIKGHWGLPDPTKRENFSTKEILMAHVILTLDNHLSLLAEAIKSGVDRSQISTILKQLSEEQ
tara:strand:+ start:442 stop:912 length:471 start_codon:yes stop_codon:yes gene_type:complete